MPATAPSADFNSGFSASGVYYEVHGRGPALFLGFPVFASPDVAAVPAAPSAASR